MSNIYDSKNDSTYYKQIGKRIESLRIERGLTKNNLAEQITDILDLKKEMAYQTITSWECGDTTRNIELKELFAICKVLECDVNHILVLSNYYSKEQEIACKTTGLSPSAIDILSKSKKSNPDFNNSLALLISNYSNSFVKLILALFEFMKSKLYRDKFHFTYNESVGYCYDDCTRFIHQIGDEAANDDVLANKLKEKDSILNDFLIEYSNSKKKRRKQN